MKKLLFLIALFCVLKANAQNYLISFAGTGASTSVASVKVENLTKGITLTVNGSDILSLTSATGVHSIKDNQSSELKIYPNPMTDNSKLEIYPPVEGNAVITVLDITGKQVAQIQNYLENSRQDFRITGIKNGFYLINVKGNNYQFSGKLLSNGKSNGIIRIEKVNNITQTVEEKTSETESKGTQATVDMAFTTGDRLKFTGMSGNYSTVKIDIPVSDKTITFNFIACTDGDNNNYPVVEIGNQVWMAENMKTTKYNDGTIIPLVTDRAAWGVLSTPAYCWYLNDITTYKTTYGGLYNWHAVDVASNSGKNVCPIDWHVPTDAQWTILTTYLGGESVAGGKMKETGTYHWLSPNTGATNESGFTALPGGSRNYYGSFDYIGIEGYWRSATEIDATYEWGRFLDKDYLDVGGGFCDKVAGISVRCLKDN